MLVTLSGFIINYVVTPASVHDSQVVEALIENNPFPYILTDLGYLSVPLKQKTGSEKALLLDTIMTEYGRGRKA